MGVDPDLVVSVCFGWEGGDAVGCESGLSATWQGVAHGACGGLDRWCVLGQRERP